MKVGDYVFKKVIIGQVMREVSRLNKCEYILVLINIEIRITWFTCLYMCLKFGFLIKESSGCRRQ